MTKKEKRNIRQADLINEGNQEAASESADAAA